MTPIQPAPIANNSRPIWELVIKDMHARDKTGRERYGVPLQAGNGRDALQDAYEEAIDLAAYLRQAIEERGKPTTRPKSLKAKADSDAVTVEFANKLFGEKPKKSKVWICCGWIVRVNEAWGFFSVRKTGIYRPCKFTRATNKQLEAIAMFIKTFPFEANSRGQP